MEQNEINEKEATNNLRSESAAGIPTTAEPMAEVVGAAVVTEPAAETESTVTTAESVGMPATTTSTNMTSTPSGYDSNLEKKGRWMPVALVICLILAIGGVGFGIWAMMDRNTRIDKLDAEVASLKSKNSELEEQIVEVDEETDATPTVKEWASTEVRDGVFYILDAQGGVVNQGEANWPEIIEVVSCESTEDNIILNCILNTTNGEAELRYDAYGDALSLTVGAE